ncbi:MAG TPA: class I SAM-dependent methyltransferase [Acidimicrobiales bacterium]|nr:class I SAM-dependent methyltransferase [Acidimicrobiales bacterium]
MALAEVVQDILGYEIPFRIAAYDGSVAGQSDAVATLVIRSPDAFSRIIGRPGELGLSRAYVAGDLDIDGDIYSVLDLDISTSKLRLDPAAVARLLRAVGLSALRPLPIPAEEARLRGGIHTRGRDRASISHHYDVSNAFYEAVLGPSMTYSCALFESPADSLETAQANKHELVSRKLGLRPGMRLLDVGCGWGEMAIHAAKNYGARVLGVTLSGEQYDGAMKRVADGGLGDRVEIRLQDYRDVADERFDAISSIGMFEHVGRRRMVDYFDRLFSLLRPGGRLLNHAIGRPGHDRLLTIGGRAEATTRRIAVAAGLRWPSRIASPFMDRYVFPDGELHEVGTVVSMMQESGFEVRHLETLREHYALTLRRWVENLESNWDSAVREVGSARARVWRLYMAASAVGFERHRLEVHQALAVRPDQGRSAMPLRARF